MEYKSIRKKECGEMVENEILLESGTNELEFVEFGIGESRFGINVIKVREIINPAEITPVPNSHPCVEGIIDIRGEVLPVVDIAKALGYPPSKNPKNDKYIISEYNQNKIVFHVHYVTQIHRVTWNRIEKPSDIYHGSKSQIIGFVRINGNMVLLLDFEKLMFEINPEIGINVDDVKKLGTRKISMKQILVAEDSVFLRQLISETMEEAGYKNVLMFENGEELWKFLKNMEQNTPEKLQEISLIITDIEMPQMDGHALTRKIKEDPNLQQLPVIIFSSLITPDLRHKGETVGANAQISKPEIAELVKRIDEMLS